MTAFKTYFKVLKQDKFVIIMYTAILLVFTVFSTTSGDTTTSFEASKPSVKIVNNDTNSEIVKNITNYLDKNAEIIELEDDEDVISDALFYKDVNAVIYIYEGYTEDYLNNKEKPLEVSFTADYQGSYTQMLLERYFKIADVVNNNITSSKEIVSNINSSLDQEKEIEVKSTLDTSKLSKANYYFTFANYSILAVCIYMIAVVMGTFNETNIKKRNIVSSRKISLFTRDLYLGNLVFTLIVWAFVVALSFFVVGDVILTTNGLWLIFNSLIFTLTALGIGFLTGNILKNKDAVTGIMNVVALGSSFLCGCFVPIDFLPDTVVTISKLLPSYWYVKNNNLIAGIESFDSTAIFNILTNIGVMLVFAIILFALALIYNKRHQRN
ncbi:MAG TPA: ABC transporter permease [Bacilli bacterium]|nr:ABC transporter permease [Bacilli bacterium]